MAKLISCKSCGHQVAKQAKTCPSCGIDKPGASKNENIFSGIAAIVIVFFIIKACIPDDKTPEELAKEKAGKADKNCTDATSAYVMSQTFVERMLKSPSTAEFPYMSDSAVSIHYLGDCTHAVVSYVDSQNSFGAIVRSKYIVELQYQKDTDTYKLLDIGIE